MSVNEPLRIYFAGTDTEVGKTYAAALFARMYRDSGVRVGVYKPVASGCLVGSDGLIAEDAIKLWNAAGQPRSLDDVCPQRFEAPLAPNAAAKAEKRTVDWDLLRDGARCWENDYDVLIIEGAGGLLTPLTDDFLNLDLVQRFAPTKLIAVAANRLGTIHQTLATCLAAKQRGVTVTGIVLSATLPSGDQSSSTNAEQIERFCDVPLLGQIPYGATSISKSVTDRLLA